MVKTYSRFIITSSIFLLFGYLVEKPIIQRQPDMKIVPPQAPASIYAREDLQHRYEYEMDIIKDPETGKVPDYINSRVNQFVKNLPSKNGIAAQRSQQNQWISRGPSNVGGRTRALAIDVRDENTILAGGVSGGVYRSVDGGDSWTRTSEISGLNSVTAIVQDTRPGHEDTWYYGTGELRGNSARIGGSPFRGDGIYKSTDGGKSWDVLKSTFTGQPNLFNSPFNYVWRLAIDHTKTDKDVIYAAVFGGIIRSEDGGETWESALSPGNLTAISPDTNLNQSLFPFYSYVTITEDGMLYATLSSFTTSGYSSEGFEGIYVSNNGRQWDNISPVEFPAMADRTIIDVDADAGVIYALVQGSDALIKLFKFEASKVVNGSYQSAWTDLSENIPQYPDAPLGDFNTQNSYNMELKIHPSDPNIVFIGATNLYRSTDGYASSENTEWIGGYHQELGGTPYPNHYPDQHALVFLPSNPNKMLSANDGGIRITEDNLADSVRWRSLNNGYVTSQFYTIDLEDVAGSDFKSGGLQDNGTYSVDQGGFSQWNRILGGDGGYSFITEDRSYLYASFQNSQIFRLTLDDNMNVNSFTRVDPTGAGTTPGQTYLFINPFIIDPGNNNRMYLAGGNAMWRNNNLSQIPGGSEETTSVNWERINSSFLSVSEGRISSIDLSTKPPNILYFGTSIGNLFRVDDVHFGDGKMERLRVDEFPDDSYISQIAIDPLNANRLMVTFSNYNIPSIFLSEDGGQTFMDISGNLEEHPDGSGSGPSIRWGDVVPLQNGEYVYFVGTDAGMYSTKALNGRNTVWLKEGNEAIGNSIIRMTDYRPSDGRYVVATHGNGIFETTIPDFLDFTIGDIKASEFSVSQSFPNPFNTLTTIQYDIPENGFLSAIIYNTSGQRIKTLIASDQFKGSNLITWDGTNTIGQPVLDGTYYIRITYQDNTVVRRVVFNN